MCLGFRATDRLGRWMFLEMDEACFSLFSGFLEKNVSLMLWHFYENPNMHYGVKQCCPLRYTKLAYIIEVSFEFYGTEDGQSVAQGVGFSEDLVVKWHLSCGTEKTKQVKARFITFYSRRCQTVVCNYGGVFECKREERGHLIWEQLLSWFIFHISLLSKPQLKDPAVLSPDSTALTYSRIIFTRLWSIFIALCCAIRCSATNRENKENTGVKTEYISSGCRHIFKKKY